MLRPITEQERLSYTIKMQADKATQELLYDLLITQKYDGFVDIWPEIKPNKKNTLVLEIKSKKVSQYTSLTNSHSTRYHISQKHGGVKQL